jgi:hypothetical protein
MGMIQEMADKQRELMESQKQFTETIQEFMGFRKKMEKRLEQDSKSMFS